MAHLGSINMETQHGVKPLRLETLRWRLVLIAAEKDFLLMQPSAHTVQGTLIEPPRMQSDLCQQQVRLFVSVIKGALGCF